MNIAGGKDVVAHSLSGGKFQINWTRLVFRTSHACPSDIFGCALERQRDRLAVVLEFGWSGRRGGRGRNCGRRGLRCGLRRRILRHQCGACDWEDDNYPQHSSKGLSENDSICKGEI